MSLIASFYNLPASELDELIAVLASPRTITTRRRLLGVIPISSKRTITWFEFLEAHAVEQAPVDHSGRIFCDLDYFLEAHGFSTLTALGIQNRIPNGKEGPYISVFDGPSAARALDVLTSAPFTAENIRAYATATYQDQSGDAESVIEALPAIHQAAVGWLRAIPPGHVGILVLS